MTIPASSIHFNDDGTAWLVVHGPADYHDHNGPLDRPCDTCGGQGFLYRDGYSIHCLDCVDGRHKFTEEVEVPQTLPKHWPAHLCVSVVPGMVLPITAEVTDSASVQIAPDGTAFQLDAYTEGAPWSGGRRVTLPPDAKPGMWAVLLKVHT